MRESFGRLPAPSPSSPPAQEGYEPIHPGSGRPERRKRLAAIGAALLAILAKAKSLLLLLPKLKLLTTFGSMLVSIAAYALLFGFPFAVGFVLLLFLHEIGHVIQLRREGVKASAPMFIPFLGAVIAAKSMGRDAAAEARVGLAGPVRRQRRCAHPPRDLACYRERLLARAGLHRLRPEPLQPASRRPPRRRPNDGGAQPDGVAGGPGGPRGDDDLLPEPDPPPDSDFRRPGELAALEGAKDARGARLLRDPRPHAGARGHHLRRPRGAAGGRCGRDVLRAQPLSHLTS